MPLTRNGPSGLASVEQKEDNQKINGVRAGDVQTTKDESDNQQRSAERDDSNQSIAPQNLLQQYLQVLKRQDKLNILMGHIEGDNDSITMDAIKNKVVAEGYSDIHVFKHDLQTLFRSIVPTLGSDAKRQEAFENLYAFAMDTLNLETQRLSKSKTVSLVDENPVVVPRTALFRPTMDGFIFSDAIANANYDDKTLPPSVQQMLIHPTPASKDTDIPNLKQTVAYPPRFPVKIHRHEDKQTIPVQWLDYGAFSSFAPTRDSNNANVSYETTYMGRAAKRFRKWEKKQRSLQTQGKQTTSKPTTGSFPTSSPTNQQAQEPNGIDADKSKSDMTLDQQSSSEDMDMSWLKTEGVDVDTIEKAAQNGSFTMDELIPTDDNDIDGILRRNGELLEYLQQYQDYRFGLGEPRWSSVDETEQNIANTFLRRMQKLVSKIPPKSLVNLESVHSAMERIPMRETAYRGSLPPNKLFAFPTNETVVPLPSIANMTPAYPKEQWRIIDVPPIPLKPVNGSDTPQSAPSGSSPSVQPGYSRPMASHHGEKVKSST